MCCVPSKRCRCSCSTTRPSVRSPRCTPASPPALEGGAPSDDAVPAGGTRLSRLTIAPGSRPVDRGPHRRRRRAARRRGGPPHDRHHACGQPVNLVAADDPGFRGRGDRAPRSGLDRRAPRRPASRWWPPSARPTLLGRQRGRRGRDGRVRAGLGPAGGDGASRRRRRRRRGRRRPARHRPASVLCVPCAHDDDVLGVLELVDKAGGGPFTFDDVELITVLANIAGSALAESAGGVVRSPDELGGELRQLAADDPTAYVAVASRPRGACWPVAEQDSGGAAVPPTTPMKPMKPGGAPRRALPPARRAARDPARVDPRVGGRCACPGVQRLDDLSPEWAWGGSTGRGVRVAIIDSGVEADHPDLGDCVDVDGGVVVSLNDEGEPVVDRRAPRGPVRPRHRLRRHHPPPGARRPASPACACSGPG